MTGRSTWWSSRCADRGEADLKVRLYVPGPLRESARDRDVVAAVSAGAAKVAQNHWQRPENALHRVENESKGLEGHRSQ